MTLSLLELCLCVGPAGKACGIVKKEESSFIGLILDLDETLDTIKSASSFYSPSPSLWEYR